MDNSGPVGASAQCGVNSDGKPNDTGVHNDHSSVVFSPCADSGAVSSNRKEHGDLGKPILPRSSLDEHEVSCQF